VPEFYLMAQLLATLKLLTWFHHTLSAVNSLGEGSFGVHYHSQLLAQLHLNLCSGVNSEPDCGMVGKHYVRCSRLKTTQLQKTSPNVSWTLMFTSGRLLVLHPDLWTQDDCHSHLHTLSCVVGFWIWHCALIAIWNCPHNVAGQLVCFNQLFAVLIIDWPITYAVYTLVAPPALQHHGELDSDVVKGCELWHDVSIINSDL